MSCEIKKKKIIDFLWIMIKTKVISIINTEISYSITDIDDVELY